MRRGFEILYGVALGMILGATGVVIVFHAFWLLPLQLAILALWAAGYRGLVNGGRPRP